MPKPLVSTDPNPNPKDVMFRHFGVLDDGKRSKGAAIFSISLNVGIAVVIVVLGMIVKTNPEMAKKLAVLTLAPKPVPPKPPPPKPPPPPPPKPLPKPPDIKELAPPKIKPPELTKPLPPEIKPVIVPLPKPVNLAPPAPLKVNPPPAPRVVSMNAPPKAASIANNDAHPSPVRLGNPELKALSGKPVGPTPVNMAGGMHNMPPSNAGSGPPSKVPSFGNGAPAGTDLAGKGRGPVVIKGLSNGVPGGTGTGARGPVSVQMAPPPVQAAAKPVPVQSGPPPKPTVIYKPEPVYTADAKAQHIEGGVTLHIKVHSDGSVEVLGVVHGLGHGLDENAVAAAKQTRFKPLVDANGHPTELDMNIIVRFQMS